MSTWRVCLLFGGETGERQVSLHSGAAVADALLRRGHSVRLLDPGTGRGDQLEPGGKAADLLPAHEALKGDRARFVPSLARLDPREVDVVAVLLHGGAGEGGWVQSILELIGIPYTGSAPGPSALAMDKVLAKRLFRAEGIPVAEEILWRPEPDGGPVSPPSASEMDLLGGYPVVVKPIDGGSTVGLTIVGDAAGWPGAAAAAAGQIDPQRGLLVERFVPGREITVGILEDRALPVVEILPKTGFYDYRRKYTKGETEYRVPADLPDRLAGEIRDRALRASRALGCRDMARVDFRLDPRGEAFCLEVNTVPGMTATSLLPMAAGAVGIGFEDLVEILCRRALARGRRGASGGREHQDGA